MPRRENPIVAEDKCLAELAQGLRSLRQARGLTLQELSLRAHYSVSALSAATSGKALPTWELAQAFVQACDGDVTEWKALWTATAEALETTRSVVRVDDQVLDVGDIVVADAANTIVASGLGVNAGNLDFASPNLAFGLIDEARRRNRRVTKAAGVLIGILIGLLSYLGFPMPQEATSPTGYASAPVVLTFRETVVGSYAPLFSASPRTPSDAGTPVGQLPAGTTVQVVCVLQTWAAIGSTSEFYLIGGPAQWSGLYTPATFFDNHSTTTDQGNYVPVDSRVPVCANGNSSGGPY